MESRRTFDVILKDISMALSLFDKSYFMILILEKLIEN